MYRIKKICHLSTFFVISYGSFQHLTIFSEQIKNNVNPKYQAKVM